jgi:LacI family transcriptional regulator
MTTVSDRKAGNPTIKDVAERAGVSVGTVSRVLNSGGNISARAIERVEAAIRALNYSPNISARQLRTGRSGTIGFCTRDITNPLFSQMARAFQDVLEDRGLTLLISNAFDDPKRERDMVRRFIEQSVDGLILAPSTDDGSQIVEMAKAQRIPVVVLDRDSPAPAIRVMSEHVGGMKQATSYLLDLGHRDIALITGGSAHLAGRNRVEGFRRAFKARDLAVPEHRILQGTFSREYGWTAASSLLLGPNPPTAIICGGTPLLLGTLPVVHSAELSIPGDLSLISCDDFDVTQLYRPAITVVRRDINAIGRTAAQAVVNLIEGIEMPSHAIFRIPTELVVRNSCGPPGSLSAYHN